MSLEKGQSKNYKELVSLFRLVESVVLSCDLRVLFELSYFRTGDKNLKIRIYFSFLVDDKKL
jgi:hypothetical protein